MLTDRSLDALYCPRCGARLKPLMWVSTPGVHATGCRCEGCGKYVRPKTLRELWEDFSQIPVNSDDDITVPFMCFTAGTDRFEVWHWFDERCPTCLYTDLLHPSQAAGGDGIR